jgi:hypothetical protein
MRLAEAAGGADALKRHSIRDLGGVDSPSGRLYCDFVVRRRRDDLRRLESRTRHTNISRGHLSSVADLASLSNL